MAKANRYRANQDVKPGGLWHQPALMNLVADVLIVMAIAALSWAALVALQRMPIFPLRQVILTAAPERVPTQLLEDAARTAVNGNFFTVDLESTRAALEKLPWVRKASLRRHWPDSLLLTLEEHEAMTRWRHLDGELALVNRHGELFSAERPTSAPHLPLLSGPADTAAELLNRHKEFNAALAPIGCSVETLVLSQRRAWQLRLDDGLTIELGRDHDKHPLDERLARFVAHYSTVKNRVGSLLVADMRYPSGFALVAAGDRGAKPPRQEAAGRKS